MYTSNLKINFSGCSDVPESVPTFGPDCTFKCHCANNTQCDVNTGECPNGCAIGYIGAGCQYGEFCFYGLVLLHAVILAAYLSVMCKCLLFKFLLH